MEKRYPKGSQSPYMRKKISLIFDGENRKYLQKGLYGWKNVWRKTPSTIFICGKNFQEVFYANIFLWR